MRMEADCFSRWWFNLRETYTDTRSLPKSLGRYLPFLLRKSVKFPWFFLLPAPVSPVKTWCSQKAQGSLVIWGCKNIGHALCTPRLLSPIDVVLSVKGHHQSAHGHLRPLRGRPNRAAFIFRAIWVKCHNAHLHMCKSDRNVDVPSGGVFSKSATYVLRSAFSPF